MNVLEFFTDEQIGRIIKQQRIYLNMTQAELGERLGVQAAAVQKWESGKVKNIKRSVLRDLSIELKLNPAILIGIPIKGFFHNPYTKDELNEIKNFMEQIIKNRK